MMTGARILLVESFISFKSLKPLILAYFVLINFCIEEKENFFGVTLKTIKRLTDNLH